MKKTSDLKRISKYGSDANCREKAESIIINWKYGQAVHSWSIGDELLVPAHSWSIGDELLVRHSLSNPSNDSDTSEQHNEVIRTAVVRDQAVRTTFARQLEIFENEPHVQTSTRKRRNSNDGFTQNANDHEEGRIPQEERDELDNQREGYEKNKTSKEREDREEDVDESRLISETRLAISITSDNISEYKLSNGSDLLTMFKRYQKNIPKPAYWGILDLTRESLYGCKEFSERDI
ncbi:19109_t:CDS:2 [Funneliformis geosporum]|nr:19109_t:CDS:2 [Funneliformis geosporum]